MAPRLSAQTSIFCVVFFIFKFLLGIDRQRELKKFTVLTRKPRCLIRILIYRTWPIQDGIDVKKLTQFSPHGITVPVLSPNGPSTPSVPILVNT